VSQGRGDDRVRSGKGQGCHTICPKQTKHKNVFSHIYANGCNWAEETMKLGSKNGKREGIQVKQVAANRVQQ
jgi:hypothetical protein